MKKIIFSIIIVNLAVLSVKSQVFNNAKLLRKNQFSIGVEPTLYSPNGHNDFLLFLHGGVGLKYGVDLGIKFGLGDKNYFGADIEYQINKNFSCSVGMHKFIDYALDGNFNINLPLTKSTGIYFGFDVDIMLNDNNDLLAWIPIGLQTRIARNLLLIVETEIAVNNKAYNIFGGGISYFF